MDFAWWISGFWVWTFWLVAWLLVIVCGMVFGCAINLRGLMLDLGVVVYSALGWLIVDGLCIYVSG